MAPLLRRFKRRRVAFVLSGGGNLGAVQIGMLRALVEAGIRPDVVIGCSVGAINGAAYAADPTLRGVARVERLWRRLAAGNPEIMPRSVIPLAVQLARRGQSLHDPGTLEALLHEELPAGDFSELRIPFHCVATDLRAAAEYWFDSGPLVPALLASASLPAVYPERDIDGRQLIDGGVLNEIHAQRAVELGASELYVLHVGHLNDRQQPVQRPFDAAMRAYWTARRYRLNDDLRRIPSHCVVHLLPAGDTPRLRFDDFSRTDDLIDAAYLASTTYLEQLAEGTPQPTPADRSLDGAADAADNTAVATGTTAGAIDNTAGAEDEAVEAIDEAVDQAIDGALSAVAHRSTPTTGDWPRIAGPGRAGPDAPDPTTRSERGGITRRNRRR